MKKGLTVIILVICIIVGVCFAVPEYKFSKDYEVSHGLTPEQTIKEFFGHIDNNNPKQANLMLLKSKYTAFSFNTVTAASAESIEDFGTPSNWNKYEEYYDAKQYLVNYKCSYLPFSEEKVFSGPTGSIFFALVKETEDSDWKIAETYTGP